MSKLKGRKRHTAMAGSSIITSELVYAGVRRGAEGALIGLVAASLPQAAPLIYGAYTAYSLIDTAIKTTREYNELRNTMGDQRALAVESARLAFREGSKQMTTTIDDAVQRQVYTSVSSMLSRPEVSSRIDNETTRGMTSDERNLFYYMFAATLSQFIVGSMIGARETVMNEVARGLIK